MEILDSHSTPIEVVAFGASAEHWDPLIEQDKVYLFSGGQVKMANKRFSTVKNDYNIILDLNSQVTPCKHSPQAIPSVVFDF